LAKFTLQDLKMVGIEQPEVKKEKVNSYEAFNLL
jgi:hypothetical protein